MVDDLNFFHIIFALPGAPLLIWLVHITMQYLCILRRAHTHSFVSAQSAYIASGLYHCVPGATSCSYLKAQETLPRFTRLPDLAPGIRLLHHPPGYTVCRAFAVDSRSCQPPAFGQVRGLRPMSFWAGTTRKGLCHVTPRRAGLGLTSTPSNALCVLQGWLQGATLHAELERWL